MTHKRPSRVPHWLSTALSFALVFALISLPFFYHPAPRSVVSPNQQVPVSLFTHPLVIGTTTIGVRYADTPSEREEGLSHTLSLGATEGMLFVFDAPGLPAFWMKDMNYSLDIVWIDANKQVIGAAEHVSPSTYPATTFSPPSPVKYVLEVPSGFVQAHAIVAGTPVSF